MWAPGPIGNMRRHMLIYLPSRRCAGIRHHARPSAFPCFSSDLVVLLLFLHITLIFLNPIFCHWR
eukprot:16444663-Heterocapsa_arctica.AAC.1